MHYSNFGLVNTNSMFKKALSDGYAIPAFNFYNIETLQAILHASEITNSPVILAVSESALDYIGDNILMGMIAGAKYKKGQIVLHLDHGHSFEMCKRAIDLGFSSVMFDGSTLPLKENISISKRIINYAHKFNVSVETELGILSGIEDKNTKSNISNYTDPETAEYFVKATNTDSLAVAIGTSHGIYKRKNESDKLRFDILTKIVNRIPKTPLVLHGASTIPQNLITNINKFGGKVTQAKGISAQQIRTAIKNHIVKVNIDSDLRLAFISSFREQLSKNKNIIDPRFFLTKAKDNLTKLCISEIQNVMGSGYKL